MSLGSVRLKKAGVCSAALFATTMFTTVAYAQAQAPQSSTALEEVVVTGSRIVRNGNEAPTPTTV